MYKIIIPDMPYLFFENKFCETLGINVLFL